MRPFAQAQETKGTEDMIVHPILCAAAESGTHPEEKSALCEAMGEGKVSPMRASSDAASDVDCDDKTSALSSDLSPAQGQQEAAPAAQAIPHPSVFELPSAVRAQGQQAAHYRLTLREIALFGAIGAAVFLCVFGLTPLDVTYDDWIINHYIEGDVVQHYAGWIAFRNSDWSFPLGQYGRLSEGVITFTDSIPWAAIFFKLFRSILPETFQYFGIYVFGCYILQGIASGAIFKLFTDRRLTQVVGTFVLCLSPIMMERAFRHTALASHWLILFALYLLFRSRFTGKVSRWYLLLGVLSIGIHPYFIPMVFAIMLADLLYVMPASGWNRRVIVRSLGLLAAALALTVLAGYLIGAIGTSDYANSGFGTYSMNLNAIYNPYSLGVDSWSLFLPTAEQTLGNYDGFNYLGLGILAALPLLIYQLVIHGKELLRRYWGLLLVCGILFVFALSNVVTFQGDVLFTYPLPAFLLKIANIFQASSRMFYPIYYLILIGAVLCVSRLQLGRGWLVALALVQLLDLTPALAAKNASFDREVIAAEYAENVWYHSETMEAIAEHTEEIRLVSYSYGRDLALWALKNGIDIDLSISNRTYYGEDTDRYDTASQELKAGEGGDTVYLTMYEDTARYFLDAMPSDREIIVYNGYYFIVKKEWNVPGDRLTAAEAEATETNE